MPQTIYWQHYGSPQNLPLILIHGWGSDSRIWQPLIPQLSHDFCVYTVDLPGYGNSLATTCNNFTDLCHAIYVSAPKQPAYWLGWSLGGLIASQIALTHSQQVKGLINVASQPYFIATEDWDGLEPTVFNQFVKNLTLNPTLTLKNFIALECLGDWQRKTIQKQLLALINPNVALATLQFGLQLLQDVDLRIGLQQLNMPQCQILGDSDKIVPATNGTENSHIIADSAHLPFLSKPEEFMTIIKNFIDKTK